MLNQTKVPQKPQKIELLNSEGPVLVAYKFYTDTANEVFVIYDEWHYDPVARFHKAELLEFVNGKRTISDSHERIWNYTEQHEGMKPSDEKLKAFIG
jgi:hypothetical protein